MRRLEELMIDGMKIYQDDELYCFTSDAVLLSRFAAAHKNEYVADFCSGSGIVGMHFYALNKRVVKHVHLFEMQPELSSLSQDSVQLNGLDEIFTIVNTRVQDIPDEYNEKFSLVLCNPPYHKNDGSAPDKIKVCKMELTLTLEEIIASAAKRLKFGGRLCMSHIPSRLAGLMFLLKKYGLEPKRCRLVRGGGKIYLVLIEALKGGKEGLVIDESEN